MFLMFTASFLPRLMLICRIFFLKVDAYARDWALATRAFSICSTSVSSATFYEGARGTWYGVANRVAESRKDV